MDLYLPSRRHRREHHVLRRLANSVRSKKIRDVAMTVMVLAVSLAFVSFLNSTGVGEEIVRTHTVSAEPHRDASSPLSWNPNLMHNEARCQKTIHFPFRVGCPQDCSPYRNEDADKYYRLAVGWSFGKPSLYNASVPWNNQRDDFVAPESFVQTFASASLAIEKQVNATIPNAKIYHQSKMHLSLSYLCCLTKTEIQRARKVILEWISKSNFDFTVRFNNIQCWYETPSSVTNIVLVDEPSQRVLFKLVQEMNDALLAQEIPVVIPRQDQMPFHSTVIGIHFGRVESFLPANNLSLHLPRIYDMVQDVSHRHKDLWNPTNAVVIQNEPHVTSDRYHTGPLNDLVQ